MLFAACPSIHLASGLLLVCCCECSFVEELLITAVFQLSQWADVSLYRRSLSTF